MLARALAAALTLLLLTPPPVAAATAHRPSRPAEAPAVVQVMVLGAYHFDNPGLDLANVKADDPTSPRRQAEIARIADALARFRPTRIMVERVGTGPHYATASYLKFTPADLLKDKDEGLQIGYRLARRLGHVAVYGIDERDGPGKPDYFPWEPLAAYSKARGDGRADALMASAKAHAAMLDAAQRISIAAALAELNDPAAVRADHALGYYGVLGEGDGDRQPGADLNAGWYLRNAKIFAKLTQVATPGDRVLVVFGAGHKYWLDHFASATPGFASVDPSPYLKRAR